MKDVLLSWVSVLEVRWQKGNSLNSPLKTEAIDMQNHGRVFWKRQPEPSLDEIISVMVFG